MLFGPLSGVRGRRTHTGEPLHASTADKDRSTSVSLLASPPQPLLVLAAV